MMAWTERGELHMLIAQIDGRCVRGCVRRLQSETSSDAVTHYIDQWIGCAWELRAKWGQSVQSSKCRVAVFDNLTLARLGVEQLALARLGVDLSSCAAFVMDKKPNSLKDGA